MIGKYFFTATGLPAGSQGGKDFATRQLILFWRVARMHYPGASALLQHLAAEQSYAWLNHYSPHKKQKTPRCGTFCFCRD